MGTPWLVVSACPDESTRTRPREPIVLLLPMTGPPLPALSEPFCSVTVLAPTIGSSGSKDWPASGATAASGSNSRGLFALKGIFEARSCVPAAFAARSSDDSGRAAGSAGPLTVARVCAFSSPDLGDFDLAIQIDVTKVRFVARIRATDRARRRPVASTPCGSQRQRDFQESVKLR